MFIQLLSMVIWIQMENSVAVKEVERETTMASINFQMVLYPSFIQFFIKTSILKRNFNWEIYFVLFTQGWIKSVQVFVELNLSSIVQNTKCSDEYAEKNTTLPRSFLSVFHVSGNAVLIFMIVTANIWNARCEQTHYGTFNLYI